MEKTDWKRIITDAIYHEKRDQENREQMWKATAERSRQAEAYYKWKEEHTYHGSGEDEL